MPATNSTSLSLLSCTSADLPCYRPSCEAVSATAYQCPCIVDPMRAAMHNGKLNGSRNAGRLKAVIGHLVIHKVFISALLAAEPDLRLALLDVEEHVSWLAFPGKQAAACVAALLKQGA
jgi:hypothetical protein